MKNNFLKNLKVIVLSMALAFFISFIRVNAGLNAADQAPSAPPANDAPALVNSGSLYQWKQGGLAVGSNSLPFSTLVNLDIKGSVGSFAVTSLFSDYVATRGILRILNSDPSFNPSGTSLVKVNGTVRSSNLANTSMKGVCANSYGGFVLCGQVPSKVLHVNFNGNGVGGVTTNPAGLYSCFTYHASTCSANFANNATVTLIPNSTDSSFGGWNGTIDANGNPCTTQPTCTILMDSDKTVTVTFTLFPKLTISKTGSGSGTVTSSSNLINCGSTCSNYYDPAEAQETLYATPDTDSFFDRYSNCTGSSGNQCNVTVNSNIVRYVSFEKKTYGTCGTANGVSTLTKPTSNLCSVGTASSVTGSGPWSWTCAGNSGSAVACGAPVMTSPFTQGSYSCNSVGTESITVCKSGCAINGLPGQVFTMVTEVWGSGGGGAAGGTYSAGSAGSGPGGGGGGGGGYATRTGSVTVPASGVYTMSCTVGAGGLGGTYFPQTYPTAGEQTKIADSQGRILSAGGGAGGGVIGNNGCRTCGTKSGADGGAGGSWGYNASGGGYSGMNGSAGGASVGSSWCKGGHGGQGGTAANSGILGYDGAGGAGGQDGFNGSAWMGPGPGHAFGGGGGGGNGGYNDSLFCADALPNYGISDGANGERGYARFTWY